MKSPSEARASRRFVAAAIAMAALGMAADDRIAARPRLFGSTLSGNSHRCGTCAHCVERMERAEAKRQRKGERMAREAEATKRGQEMALRNMQLKAGFRFIRVAGSATGSMAA